MSHKTYTNKIPMAKLAAWVENAPLDRLDMELTERCNNNCVHCYINRPVNDIDAQNLELPFAKIRQILEEAVCLGCKNVRFTGGEPLLRVDFEDIYLYAKQLGLKVEIFTNGTRITPRLAEIFKKSPPGESIQVSLYGENQKKYEAVSRMPGSFEAAQRGMALLSANDVPFVVKAVVLPLTKKAFSDFECWAQKAKELHVPKPPITTLHLRCREGDGSRNKQIKALRLQPEEQLELEASRSEDYLDDLKNFCAQFCHVVGDSLFHCGAGIHRASVDAYGKLQLCLLLRHPDTVYDLNTGSLANALGNFFPRVRQLKAKNPLYLERCARCFLIALCEQCPAVSWMENRVLDGWPEHFCRFTHAQARHLGLLEEGEKSWMVADGEKRVKKLSHSTQAVACKPIAV
ncbi:MAG TPA: radical SAM protein [bacterium]|nr:radical SAM protein [bacterium]